MIIWGVLGLVAFLLVAAFLYWQLILAEGAYLGAGVVAWLYDISAHVYDKIKDFDVVYEHHFLGSPLAYQLKVNNFSDPLILDVATGTARLARSLYEHSNFSGRLIGVDLSRKMLEKAVQLTQPWSDKVTYVWQNALQLPFADQTFDAVSCLEALEFLPDHDLVLQEMLRVLRPGGIFLITNRIGNAAVWMPGRIYTPEGFVEKLQALPLEMVRSQPWQQDYELLWAVKSGVPGAMGLRRLEEVLRCPQCRGTFTRENSVLLCENGHRYSFAADGILDIAGQSGSPRA